MGSIRFIALLAATSLLAAAGIVAACGGGGEASTEEYFKELQVISDDANKRFEGLFEEFGAAFDPSTSEEERLDAAPKFADEAVSIARDAYDKVSDLDPPSEVEDAHSEFVAAIGDFQRALEGVADRAGEIDSATELDRLFEGSPEVEASDERITKACKALEGIAADKGIKVDLDCEEEE